MSVPTSNAGGAGGVDLINPEGFPCRAGDLDVTTVIASADGVSSIGSGVLSVTSEATTAWTGVTAPGVFQTPDDGVVQTLLEPAAQAALDLHGVTSSVSAALHVYAGELAAIKPLLADLEERAWSFRAEALQGYEVTKMEAQGFFGSLGLGSDWLPFVADDAFEMTTIPWTDHGPAIETNTALVQEHNELVERISGVVSECTIAIQAELTSSALAPTVITAEDLAASPEDSVWGHAVEENRNATESVGHGLTNFGSGLAAGLLSLVGFDPDTGLISQEHRVATLLGVGDFALSTALTLVFSGTRSGSNAVFRGPFADFLTDRENVAATGWGALIGWDHQTHLAGGDGWHEWSEDGIATFTESAANIGTFFIPAAGAAKVVVSGSRVASLVARISARAAEFAVPAGSHLVAGVVRGVNLTSAGVRGGWQGLIDAVRHPVTAVRPAARPAVMPGVMNVALEPGRVAPAVPASDILGLETTPVPPVQSGLTNATEGIPVRPGAVQSGAPRLVIDEVPTTVPETIGSGQVAMPHTSADRIVAWENAWRDADGVRVDPRTGAPLVEFNRAGGAGWEMRWVPEWNEWVAFNRGDGWGATPRPLPEGFDVDYSRANDYASGDVHHPGDHPPHTPEVSYVRGADEPGWAPVNRGPERPWMAAQEQISGIVRDDQGRLLEWHQPDPETGRVVQFDGHTWRGGPPPVEVFLEVKDNHRQLYTAPESEWSKRKKDQVVSELMRQTGALPEGARLEWHVTDHYGAAAVRRILAEENLDDVEVIFTPRLG